MRTREICRDVDALYRFFRRTRIAYVGKLSDEALAERLGTHAQVLCIVRTRSQAQRVYGLLGREGAFHLSTLMYPEHRSRVLDEIRKRLKDGLPCRVVSTNLIEAGVDVDFPAVYKCEDGLDSVLQAAGRCNREGRRHPDESVVYVYETETPVRWAWAQQLIQAAVSARREYEEVSQPPAIARYFKELHLALGEDVDKKKVVEELEAGEKSKSFPFRTIASEFKLIEDRDRTVLIPQGEGEALAKRLTAGERSRELMRKAGRYSVGLHPGEYRKLRDLGAIEELDEEIAILRVAGAYSDVFGVDLSYGGGVGMFS